MVKITNIKHRLYMPMMKKYEVYGKFPWKLIVQVLLIVFTTTQTLLLVNQTMKYSYSQYLVWNKLFTNTDAQGSDLTITDSFNIFGINRLVNYIQLSVDTYYNINSRTIDDYSFLYESDGSKRPVKLLIEYFDNAEAIDDGLSIEYSLTPITLGIFDSLIIKNHIKQVKKFQLHFTIIHRLNNYIDLPGTCYQWDLIQKYDFSSHGQVTVKLETNRIDCSNAPQNILKRYLWVSICICILALMSLLSVVNYVKRRLELVIDVMGMNSGTGGAWEKLGLKEKLKFFNFWIVFNVIGNVFQIFGAILSFLDSQTLLRVHDTIVGFGCFFAWIGVVRFLDHSSPSYTIVNTMGKSAETIGFYIIGVVPIFLGFAFLGLCLFWKTGIYSTTPMSILANFALVNGDSVYAFTTAGQQESSFIGQLYFYTYIVFFICCVHNLFIAIIERAFSSLRENPETQEDSDEEISEQNIIKEADIKSKRNLEKKSKKAFKKILNSGKADISFNEGTLQRIQAIDSLVILVLEGLKTLERDTLEIIDRTRDENEREMLRQSLRDIIDYQLEPIISNFN